MSIPKKSSLSAWPELRAELRAQGLSLADLSRFLGVRYLTISRFLNGYTLPPPELVERIAAALGVEIERIRPQPDRADRALAEIRSRTEQKPRLAQRTMQALRGEIPSLDLESER